MTKPYKGRSIEIGQQVRVYRHLRKHCFTIQDHQTGLVVAHADPVTLKDVVFRVSEAGRQRLLRDNIRNIHALAIGTLQGFYAEEGGILANYYPNQHSTFTTGNGKPVTQASKATFYKGKIYLH